MSIYIYILSAGGFYAFTTSAINITVLFQHTAVKGNMNLPEQNANEIGFGEFNGAMTQWVDCGGNQFCPKTKKRKGSCTSLPQASKQIMIFSGGKENSGENPVQPSKDPNLLDMCKDNNKDAFGVKTFFDAFAGY